MEIQKSEIIHPASAIEDIALTATLPSEMVESQQQLISWCDKKVAVCQDEVRELWDSRDRAKKMKWKWQPLHNLWRGASKRLAYYEKVNAALRAGFYIVPNFPIQMFAIRTKKEGVSGYAYGWRNDLKQDAQELPAGEGEYRNPFPLIQNRTIKNSDNSESNKQIAKDWDDLEFPITMAKPEIIDATSRAMALKIFDQIGIMPATRKEDPVIIGQIFLKKGFSTKTVSFMIAWFLDTRMI